MKLLVAVALCFQEAVETEGGTCQYESCFQEAVETEGGTRQYESWALPWGEDEECAFSTLDALYNNLRKQVMGITAQEV